MMCFGEGGARFFGFRFARTASLLGVYLQQHLGNDWQNWLGGEPDTLVSQLITIP